MKPNEIVSPVERVVTISVQTPEISEEDFLDSNQELVELIKTIGGQVVGSCSQKRHKLDRIAYFGRGKIDEVKRIVAETNATIVVADDELSYHQTKTMEDVLGVAVLDRTSVILKIFANNASTREGMLQVELAGLQYQLPRLVGGYRALSRQRGGIGTKGPGETQLETDRRTLKKRIKQIQEEIEHVVQNRKNQRNLRNERFAPLFSLVGYTNAGKSTLLNALSGSAVTVKDALFTTLDPTSRRIELPTKRFAILSDTVGFIQKIPHSLIQAFRATLDEVVNSQILLLVCDIGNSRFKEHIATVTEVLREIGAVEHERIIVFNKIDLTASYDREALLNLFPGGIFISAKTGEGLNDLKTRMDEVVSRAYKWVEMIIPSNSPLLKEIYRVGRIDFQEWAGEKVFLKAELPSSFIETVSKYVLK
ncbi:GTPase HflX [bacterium]|nr:GTPase HflX [bacterium]